MNRRAIIIVLDSVGIGETPDSYLYGDEGSYTLQNTALAVGGLELPNLQKLGLGNIAAIEGVPPAASPAASYGKMQEKSRGKDTTTGHWEMMGIVLERAFPTYPEGFPDEVIKEFETLIGRKTLGNIVASGTVIIEKLGREHMETGYPIVYTSADSVFQIAAHEEIIPLQTLYEMCQKARQMLQGEHGVGRVIARPFIGKPGNFTRTANRHDFSLQPDKNILDYIIAADQEVIGIGKIKDIFAGRGVTESYPTESNQDGVNKLLKVLQKDFTGLIFVNLVDFDQLYGHRNDPPGYARALQEFDIRLPEIMARLNSKDMLIITADHGCDPTTPSTDHSREYVPLLIYGESLCNGSNLGLRESFADIGITVADYLQVSVNGVNGQSVYSL
ncbi:MAG: phosphopentomutase [Syntrophomonadaceae bacterium]|nr:phosphopentomutase [Syntrophomonadaceae bacterium]MDD3888477.1 phosphopentomutase [Syntrophomonadaceae bacterium]MDD4548717.1 phosphopentomutase [Syntrophomonadaceae bacterium]